MSYQVVNPASGELAASFPDKDKDLAVAMAEELCKHDGKRWDVLEIRVIYSAIPVGKHGSEPLGGRTDS